MYSRLGVLRGNVFGHHNHEAYGKAVGGVGEIPVAPDQVFDPKGTSLFGELTTKSSVTCDHHRNSFGLREDGSKNGDRFPRTSREYGNNGLALSSQDRVKEKTLVVARKRRSRASCVKLQDLQKPIFIRGGGGGGH